MNNYKTTKSGFVKGSDVLNIPPALQGVETTEPKSSCIFKRLLEAREFNYTVEEPEKPYHGITE